MSYCGTQKETPQSERPTQNKVKKIHNSVIHIHTLSLTKRLVKEEAADGEVSMYIHRTADS